MIHKASLHVHLMTQANEGQRMFMRMRGRYQHEAIETKDVGRNTSGNVGVAQNNEQMSRRKWAFQFSINLQLVLVL